MQAVPVDFISQVHPPAVELYNGRGVVVTVANPRLAGDTVVGTGIGGEVAIPLNEVQRISTVRFSSARTAVLISGLVSAGAIVAYVALSNAKGREGVICEEDNQSQENPLCDINR